MGIRKVCGKPRPRPRPRPKPPIFGAEEFRDEVLESAVGVTKEGGEAACCFLLGTMTLAVGAADFIGKWLLVYEIPNFGQSNSERTKLQRKRNSFVSTDT